MEAPLYVTRGEWRDYLVQKESRLHILAEHIPL